MKIRDALDLLQVVRLLQSSDIARRIKVGYMLAYNKRILEAVKRDFDEALKDDEYDAFIAPYDAERIALLNEAADKNEDGSPKIEDGVFQLSDASAIARVQTLLHDKYPTAQRIIEARAQKVEQLLDEEQDVPLRKLPLNEWPDLPANMPLGVMDVLAELIED